MTPRPTWEAVDAALDVALGLGGPDRDAYLAALPHPLGAEVREALALGSADDALLDHPDRVIAAFGGPLGAIGAGHRVGPYRLEALVGEGGMGRVFRARRADGAFEQTVAVKVVRRALVLAGADVADRLRRERRTLAALDHPNIARLLDGGETPDGVPFLVTEFVDGLPITDYADAHGLGVRERVRLMAEVARAVDHAHRRFIVHRDLKPSNVLVTEREGPGGAAEPRPVVVDFGIAKLLEEDGDESLLTRTGAAVLTPAYAAPELFEPGAAATTGADVFGLGAVLFELLTGTRWSPSERALASRVAAAGASAAAPEARAVRPDELRGDLDLICRTALRRNPTRRYRSAAAFAEDLERHLSSRPIAARADSVAYVTARFVRRNRGLVAALTVGVAALVAGLAIALTALDGETRARATAEAEAARAEEAVDLLGHVFEAANPATSGRPDVSVREALDVTLAQARSVESAALRGRLLGLLGTAYLDAGDVAAADSLFRDALDLLDPSAPPDLAAGLRMSAADAARILMDNERAADLYRTVVATVGTDDPLGVRAAGALLVLPPFDVTSPADRIAAVRAARALVRQADARRDTLQLLEALEAHARVVNWYERRPTEAVRVTRRVVEIAALALGPEHSRTRALTLQLARALSNDGQVDEAVALGRAIVASEASVFGPQSYAAGRATLELANTFFAAGRYAESAEVLASALDVLGHALPASHVNFGWWTQELSRAYRLSGSPGAAVGPARRALALAEAHGSPPLLGRCLAELGLSLAAVGEDAEARAVLRRAEAVLQEPVDMAPIYVAEAARGVREVRAALARLGG